MPRKRRRCKKDEEIESVEVRVKFAIRAINLDNAYYDCSTFLRACFLHDSLCRTRAAYHMARGCVPHRVEDAYHTVRAYVQVTDHM